MTSFTYTNINIGNHKNSKFTKKQAMNICGLLIYR